MLLGTGPVPRWLCGRGMFSFYMNIKILNLYWILAENILHAVDMLTRSGVGAELHEVGLDELVELAVEHSGHVRGLVVGAVVLDATVVHHV